MSHTLALITVVYQNYDVLQDFLNSCAGQQDQDYHVFIADLSTDRKPIQSDVPLTVLESENRGYAHGVNVALRAAAGQGITRFCVINDDTYFKPEFVEAARKSIDRHPKTIIGGKIYYAPGFEYHTGRYGKNDAGRVLWYAGGITDWDHVTTSHRGVDQVDGGKYDHEEPTEFITGCLMCYDRAAYESVGDWDESYFLYFEDADFCARAVRAGIPLLYDPSMKIWHKSGQSTEGASSQFQQKYMKKNRVAFGLRYAPFRTKLHILKNLATGKSF